MSSILLQSLCWLLLLSSPAFGQVMPASVILKNCVVFHDPENKWPALKATFNCSLQSTAGKQDFSVGLDRNTQFFQHTEIRQGHTIIRSLKKKNFKATLDGKSQFTSEQEKAFGLDELTTARLKEAFEYVSGAPMRQAADTKFLRDEVQLVDFGGKPCYQLEFHYPNEGSGETWHLMVNRETAQLEGARIIPANNRLGSWTFYCSEWMLFDEIMFPAKKTWSPGPEGNKKYVEIIESIKPLE